MKKTTWAFILLLSITLPVSIGLAQQQLQQSQDQGKQGQQASQSDRLQWAQKSSDILDKKFISRDGKDLGTAEDLVIGKDGKIEYVILSTGGFLGMGGDKVAVPWDKVRSTPNVDQMMADISQSEIEKYSGGEKKSTGAGKETARSDWKEPAMPFAQLSPEHTGEFMDKKVVGKNGEELGKVTDLFTTQDGRPLYVVIQDQDQANRYHPVPAQQVLARPADKSLSVDFDKQAFQSSPSYDPLQLSRQQWEPEVRGYYQEQPSPGRGQSGRQPMQEPGMSERQLPYPTPGQPRTK